MEIVYMYAVAGNRNAVEAELGNDGNINHALIGACEGGWSDLAESLIHRGATDFNPALKRACRHGRRDTVDMLLKYYDRGTVKTRMDLTYGLAGACAGGYDSLIELMMSVFKVHWVYLIKPAFQYNRTYLLETHDTSSHSDRMLLGAAAGGHLRLVHQVLNQHAVSSELLSSALRVACEHGRSDIVQFLIPRVTYFEPGLYGACASGRVELVELMLSHGAVTITAALADAAGHGDLALAQMLVQRNPKMPLKVALMRACQGGHVEMAQWLISQGATNFARAFIESCKFGQLKLVKVLPNYLVKTKSPQNFQSVLTEGFDEACLRGHLQVVEYLMPYRTYRALDYACTYGSLDLVKLVYRDDDNVNSAFEELEEGSRYKKLIKERHEIGLFLVLHGLDITLAEPTQDEVIELYRHGVMELGPYADMVEPYRAQLRAEVHTLDLPDVKQIIKEYL